MKARIKWVENRTFIGESGSGHKVVLGTASGPEDSTLSMTEESGPCIFA
jgi:putative redox protein